jgi:hypothetical protein
MVALLAVHPAQRLELSRCSLTRAA